MGGGHCEATKVSDKKEKSEGSNRKNNVLKQRKRISNKTLSYSWSVELTEFKCVLRCVTAHLLLGQPLLDLLVVTDAVGDGAGQLGLYATQPRAEVTHVLIQLLHRHQSLFQLLHPAMINVSENVSNWLVSPGVIIR